MTLTALDFLGFGLPPGSPSLGELLKQGKNNLQAPWLGFTGFFVIALMLSLLVFIGEAVRDAFDPRKTFAAAARERRRRGADVATRRRVERRRRRSPSRRASDARCSRVDDLRVRFGAGAGAVDAVRGVSLRDPRAARRWRWSARAARASR